jgi:hypothetical protein
MTALSKLRNTALKVLMVDLVLVVAEFLVIQDLQWRSSYAAAAVNRCAGLCSYAPSLSYGFLTHVFTMSGNSVQLSSPTTFDWVQAIAYALALLNGWLIYKYVQSRRAPAPGVAGPANP